MKNCLLILLVFCCGINASAQKFASVKSVVTFYSDAAIEDIKATNKKGSSLFDASTGEIVFSIPINGFQFRKALMQEHFNEKYMESEKYPKATFQGTVQGFQKDSPKQNLKANGKLTIHGVTKDLVADGTFEQKGKVLLLRSKFMVVLEDYNIQRPQVLWQNIAEQVEVTVEFEYKLQ
jgi:polyisoprenoid-binding protein YceI